MKAEIEAMLEPDEQYAHCIDSESFGGRYFLPQMVVTSYGRIFTLSDNKPRQIKCYLEECGPRNKKGELIQKKYFYRIGNGEHILNIKAHQIVANYFCDKSVVEMYGEENVEVHHIGGYDTSYPNTYLNRWDRLQYAYIPSHNDMSLMQRGSFKRFDIDDPLMQMAISNAKCGDIFSKISADGTEEIHVLAKCDGTKGTPQKPEKILRELANIKIKKADS